MICIDEKNTWGVIMKKYLLLLGADQFLRERSYSGAKSVGDFEVWTAIKNAKYKYNAYFDFCMDADSLNYEELKQNIEKYKEKGFEPKAIVPLNDWTLKVANKLNKNFGLPFLNEKTVNACRNKKLMKSHFIKNKVSTPKSMEFEGEKQLNDMVKEFKFPVIIKPLEFGGSGGVYLANNIKECVESYHKSKNIMEIYADSFNVSKSKFLIEEFIDSEDEVSVEVLCGDGFYEVITVTEKYLSPKPWFTEMGHLVPSHRYQDDKIKKLAIDTCRALGINRGIAHVEIKIKENNLYVIEAAARPGGDAIMDLIESSYEINPYKLHVAMYIDNKEKIIEDFVPKRTSAIAFLKAEKGIITDIKYPDVSKDEEIKRISLLNNIGDVAGEPENWSNREGIIQMNWDGLVTEKDFRHINKAKKLSNDIFTVSDISNE